MIKFILKGLTRDRHRSFFPILIVIVGVMLTVLVQCWITGIIGNMLDVNAKFTTGHVKVMTHAYAENIDQKPNDLALLEIDELFSNLQNTYPDMQWVKRIQFGGLLDAPDENGETKAQGPTIGLAVDLFSENGNEIERLQIEKSLIKGRLPKKSGEILISGEFAEKLKVEPGDIVTLLGSTMYGSMAINNFTITGTVQFGIVVMDKGTIITDISDIQFVLDMNNACSEILGYFDTGFYDNDQATIIVNEFNKQFSNSDDEFTPLMLRLIDQNDLKSMLDYISTAITTMMIVFLFTMSLVLWNAGLIGGLRRYGEVGVRLAIGENKGHVYRSMIYESVLVGLIGTVIGTTIGLGLAYLLQIKGYDVSSMMKNTSMMVSSVYRAQITPPAFFIGFIPGLFSTPSLDLKTSLKTTAVKKQEPWLFRSGAKMD